MPGFEQLGMMEGIAIGMEKLTSDLEGLSLAKERLKREREEYEKQNKILDKLRRKLCQVLNN